MESLVRSEVVRLCLTQDVVRSFQFMTDVLLGTSYGLASLRLVHLDFLGITEYLYLADQAALAKVGLIAIPDHSYLLFPKVRKTSIGRYIFERPKLNPRWDLPSESLNIILNECSDPTIYVTPLGRLVQSTILDP